MPPLVPVRRAFARLSLRSKLVAIITLPMICLVTLVLVVATVDQIQRGKQSLAATTKAIVLAIGQDFERMELLGDRSIAAEIVDHLQMFPAIEFLFVYDLRGKICFCYRRPDRPAADVPPAPKSESLQFADGWLHMVLALKSSAGPFATAYVQASTEEVDREARRAVSTTIAVGLIVAVVGVFAALLLERLISRPILELQRTAKKVTAENDYSARAGKFSEDEVGAVADAFNAMLMQIQRSSSALKLANDELETRVAERTTTLAEANDRLRQVNSETQLLVSSISSILIRLDKDGLVTKWNAAAETLLGVCEADALGRNWTDMRFLWPQQQVVESVEELLAQRIAGRCENVCVGGPATGEHVLSIAVTPIWDQEQFAGLLLLGVDRTEQTRLELHLRQAQKLESIGSLAAGIAHEINTPIQYVRDNTCFLSDSFSRLRELVQEYDRAHATANGGSLTPEILASIERARQEADADFVLEELPAALSESLEGLDRIAAIVRAMKEFSHPGSTDKSLVNLNDNIVNTITVARNEWKYVAEVVTELDPDLPPVPCLAGDLNQVILNLIVNAAHAIAGVAKSAPSDKGTIAIRTRRVGDQVEFEVSDTGTGIPEAIRSRVFDPFFTTKEPGKGTGQGLAIARSVIVDKHRGTIDLHSELGKGTTFIVRLPLQTQSLEKATRPA